MEWITILVNAITQLSTVAKERLVVLIVVRAVVARGGARRFTRLSQLRAGRVFVTPTIPLRRHGWHDYIRLLSGGWGRPPVLQVVVVVAYCARWRWD